MSDGGPLPQRAAQPQGLPAYQNSGLARFGASFNPYMPPTYTPRVYQPPQLPARMGLAGMAPPAAAQPGLGSWVDSGGIGGGATAGESGIGGPSGGGGGGITAGIGGFSNPDNSIAPGQTNTTGVAPALGLAALAAIAPTPANVVAAVNAFSNISQTVGPASISPEAMAAASIAAQADTDPATNGTVGDGIGGMSGADGIGGGIGSNAGADSGGIGSAAGGNNGGGGVSADGDSADGDGGDGGGGGSGGGK